MIFLNFRLITEIYRVFFKVNIFGQKSDEKLPEVKLRHRHSFPIGRFALKVFSCYCSIELGTIFHYYA